jgi:hypothetical protein
MVVYVDLGNPLPQSLNDSYVIDEEQDTAMASGITGYGCDCKRAGLKCIAFEAYQRYPLLPL